jgi:hypothetical protein
MANGYCPALLRHIRDIAAGNTPGRRLSPAGFTAMLLNFQNSLVSPINDSWKSNGHVQGMTLKYRRRPTEADVTDEDNCEINSIPQYLEWNIPNLLYRQHSFFLSDEEIQKYCDEASRSVSIGRPATQIMQEHYEVIIEATQALMRSINTALVTAMATQFGDNLVSGSNTGRVINIAKAGTDMTLDDGFIALLSDMRENEICDDTAIVGGGLFSAFDLSRAMLCCSNAGIDLGRLGLPRFYFDKDTQAIWGQDSIGVFTPGSVKFLSRNRYVGAFAGQKGNSTFFTMPLPVNELYCADSNLRDLIFDVQLRYIDCPTTIDVAGVPTVVNRGWQFIISKLFGLWVLPTDGYNAGDVLEGTNGTFKYFITNDETSPGA